MAALMGAAAASSFLSDAYGDDINEFVKWSNIFGEYSRGYSGKGYKFGNYDYGTMH